MCSAIPQTVANLELFLKERGLICQSRKGPDPVFFGNTCLHYRDNFICIRLASDRGFWTVNVADAARSDVWYDIGILRDFLIGHGEDILPLPDQVAFIRTNWQAVLGCFNQDQREKTHAQLSEMMVDRAKRRFPALYTDK